MKNSPLEVVNEEQRGQDTIGHGDLAPSTEGWREKIGKGQFGLLCSASSSESTADDGLILQWLAEKSDCKGDRTDHLHQEP